MIPMDTSAIIVAASSIAILIVALAVPTAMIVAVLGVLRWFIRKAFGIKNAIHPRTAK